MVAMCGSAGSGRGCGEDAGWAGGGCNQTEKGQKLGGGEYCELERRLVEAVQAQCEKRRARDGRQDVTGRKPGLGEPAACEMGTGGPKQRDTPHIDDEGRDGDTAAVGLTACRARSVYWCVACGCVA
jgi:hypothetical protein